VLPEAQIAQRGTAQKNATRARGFARICARKRLRTCLYDRKTAGTAIAFCRQHDAWEECEMMTSTRPIRPHQCPQLRQLSAISAPFALRITDEDMRAGYLQTQMDLRKSREALINDLEKHLANKAHRNSVGPATVARNAK
jgi:hypothetical protein